VRSDIGTTAKRLHSIAQGKRRSRATLGDLDDRRGTPTGFYNNVSDPYRVAFGWDNNPGWRLAAVAAALTLGYGV
jgi:hypothetical protein